MEGISCLTGISPGWKEVMEQASLPAAGRPGNTGPKGEQWNFTLTQQRRKRK